MTSKEQIVFLINLLQDVNIVRPLIYLARMHFSVPIVILTSEKFVERDKEKTWHAEIQQIAADTNSELHVYDSEWTAYRFLQGKTGLLIAASESSLSAHFETHKIFQAAPSAYLKITLQHGFEGVGFLQNREHDRAHGKNITFAADVLCGWCDPSVLTSMTPSERPKLYVSGPPTLIHLPRGQWDGRASNAGTPAGGLVCENLHSVRLRVGTDTRSVFLNCFFDLCSYLADRDRGVTLRPHPGGQYVLKNAVALPPNVTLNNRPIYKLDLRDFEYGISATSSIIFDMVLAGIPVAVWQDEDGLMDVDNYRGLVTISDKRDWIGFVRDVAIRKEAILDRQASFLRSKKMLTDPDEIRKRFARLFGSAIGGPTAIEVNTQRARRVLFVANGFIPTLQLSFLKPLAPDIESGALSIDLITEAELIDRFLGKGTRSRHAAEWVGARMEAFAPDLIVFVRYSGAQTRFMLDQARKWNIATIFHIDDDMLNVPREIGEKKYLAHNRPHRLEAVRNLLQGVDLVYCSTQKLLERFRALGFRNRMVAGEIYCSGRVVRKAVDRPVAKIGYMGFDHAADFALVVPPLVKLLRNQPQASFEIFGPIPKPAALDEFGHRVSTVAPVRNYDAFLQRLADLEWDIGLCPLETSPFNALKANTKWVEYTAAGIATIATRGMAYDGCCSDDCGILAATEEEWGSALATLCTQSDLRYRMVLNAQARLTSSFSTEALRRQIYRIFDQALIAASSKKGSIGKEVAGKAEEPMRITGT